jgi:hypothetical protein
MTIAAVMVIRGSAQAGYTGTIDSEMGSAAISDIRVDGQTLRFSIADVGLEAQVTIEGDSLSGGMTGAMGEAGVVGKKRPGA